MKQLFYIADSAENKISFYHLALFLMLLPFDYFYSQLVLISFGVHTLIHLQKKRVAALLKKQTWLPALVFLILLLSVVYSTDKKEGLDISGRQAGLLLFPVLLALTNLNIAQYKHQLLQLFALTCTAVILYLYGDALYTIRYFNLPVASLFTAAFTNHNFSQPIALHATYLAMYTALSFAVLLYHFFQSAGRLTRLCTAGGMCVLAAGLVQLTSRAVVTALLLTVVAGFAFFLLEGKRKWIITGISILVSVAAGILVLQNDAFKQRYISELKNDLANQPVSDEMLEPRILRWQLALALIKKSPVTGYGNGTEKKLLQQEYFKNRFYISYLRGFNAHSQYLSFLLRTGIAGLAVFLVVLGFAFRTAWMNRDFLFFAFLVITATVAVSENILDVNKGIFFYGFFLSLFLTGQAAGRFTKATE